MRTSMLKHIGYVVALSVLGSASALAHHPDTVGSDHAHTLAHALWVVVPLALMASLAVWRSDSGSKRRLHKRDEGGVDEQQ